MVKCGLGKRLGYLVVSLFGRSTLGLGYSIFLLDAVIAPAFPSNTARSGVLYPVIYSLAQSSGSRPEDGTQKRLGSYLMFCGMASLCLSSGLWLTAMAGNALGIEIAKNFGLTHHLRLLVRRLGRAHAGHHGPAAAPALQAVPARGESHAGRAPGGEKGPAGDGRAQPRREMGDRSSSWAWWACGPWRAP